METDRSINGGSHEEGEVDRVAETHARLATEVAGFEDDARRAAAGLEAVAVAIEQGYRSSDMHARTHYVGKYQSCML